jgi:hypothetical protein
MEQGGIDPTKGPPGNYKSWWYFPAISENQNDFRLNLCHRLNFIEPHQSLSISDESLLHVKFNSKLKK